MGLASWVCVSNGPTKAGFYLTLHAGTPLKVSLEDPESLWVLASGFLTFTHGVSPIAELSLCLLCFLASERSSLVWAIAQTVPVASVLSSCLRFSLLFNLV